MPRRPSHPSFALALALALFCGGCGGDSKANTPEPARGFVVLDAANPDRPFFHDFGNVSYGERRVHRFHMRNTDDVEVRVLSTLGACACSKVTGLRTLPATGEPVEADFARKEDLLRVPPGGELEFVVTVDTAKTKPNEHKLAIMTVRTSSVNSPFLTFELHIKSEKLFTINPAEIRIGDAPKSSGGWGATRIMTGVAGAAARILPEPVEHSERIEASLEHIVVGNENIWTLTATVRENQPPGPLREVVTLHTTDADGQGDAGRLEVVVWAQVTEDIKLYPPLLSFLVIEAGQSGEVGGRLRALVPGARMRILGARIEGELADHFQVRHKPVSEDGQGRSHEWLVHVSADEHLPVGRFDGRLVLSLDDSRYPEISAAFSGYVR